MLQEVLQGGALGRYRARVLLRGRLERPVRALQVLVEREDRGDVAAPVAVVGRAPDGHDRVVEHELVALHDELVRARDEVEIVRVHKLPDDVAAEQEAGPARRQSPSFDVYACRQLMASHVMLVATLTIWVGP